MANIPRLSDVLKRFLYGLLARLTCHFNRHRLGPLKSEFMIVIQFGLVMLIAGSL